MKNFHKIFLPALLGLLAACGNSGEGSADSVKVIELNSDFPVPGESAPASGETEEDAGEMSTQMPLSASDEEIAAFIRQFYADCVFGGKDFQRYRKHFSEKLLARMEKDYSPDGGGYAVWDFRIAEVMESNEHDRVTAVNPEGDGWYAVSFINDTYSATIPVKAVVENGWVTIQDIREVTDITPLKSN